MDCPAGSPEWHRPPGRGTKLIPARGSAALTFPTNRRSLAPGMELDAPLNSGESYSLGNRCQFVAIAMRNILSLADASQQGNRALCGGKRSKGFSPKAHSAHLIHLLLSLSLPPSIMACGHTIYGTCISTATKPLREESELEMNLSYNGGALTTASLPWPTAPCLPCEVITPSTRGIHSETMDTMLQPVRQLQDESWAERVSWSEQDVPVREERLKGGLPGNGSWRAGPFGQSPVCVPSQLCRVSSGPVAQPSLQPFYL